jgi:hypothetical protein
VQGERERRTVGGHERGTLAYALRYGVLRFRNSRTEREAAPDGSTVMRLCRKTTRESQSDSSSVLPRPSAAWALSAR